MYVAHLSLVDFRSYPAVELELDAGVSVFLGRNGQGKTNLIEAVDYLSRLGSHRVAGEAPLIRAGAERAVIRAAVVRDGRTAVLEVELTPGRANRARINRSVLPRARDLIGLVRCVVFSPEDLSVVKGDPGERRRFLDDLAMMRAPRLNGLRADYERIVKQRNALLKSARAARAGAPATLEVWDEQLITAGAEVWAERLRLLEVLRPRVATAYAEVATGRVQAELTYRSSSGDSAPDASAADLAALLRSAVERRRRDELDRAVSLVGPHRDELELTVSDGSTALPVRGYASHGETWSYALALRLGSYDLLRAEGDDPILILDDVFAELDQDRRTRLAERVGAAEQLLVTAAVAEDVPAQLGGARFTVAGATVSRDDQ